MLDLGRTEILIFSFFILLTLVITYPVVFKMDRSIFSDPEWTFDSLGSVADIWWAKHAWVNKFPATFKHLVAFPFGVDISQAPRQPFTSYPLLVLSLWQNELFAYNCFILAGFVLSCVTVYCLVYYLTKDKLASMVSGIIFSFCPNHSLQSFSHYSLAAIQWMPLYVLFLLRLDERKSYCNAIFWAFTFSLVVLSNYYYGYFMVIVTVGFVFFKMGYSIWGERYGIGKFGVLAVECSKMFKVIVVAGAIALVIILPFAYSTIKTALSPSKLDNADSRGYYVRSYGDLFKYAARIYDYVLPSEYHPIFGKFTKEVVRRITGGRRHWAERTLYLGLMPSFLAIVGVMRWKKRRTLKRLGIRENFSIPFFLFLALLAFYCSLSPLIGRWKIKIPSLSLFLYHIAPMFRVYARMGFVVTLSVAVLAGFGLRDILANTRGRRKQIGVSLAFSSLIFFEYTVIPPFRSVDLSKVPAVYGWLASQPEAVVVAEYPWLDSIEEGHCKYLFYQRVHKKRMVNGASTGTLGDAVRKEAIKIMNPQTPSILSYLGANYVIVHKDSYKRQEMERINENPGLMQIKDFPEAVVYEVVAKKPELVKIFFKNFAMWERWDDGSVWRWAGNNATMLLYNTTREKMSISFEFSALSFRVERLLEIFLNDELMESIQVGASVETTLAKRIHLRMGLMPGENILRFQTPQGETRIDDILHNGDRRNVSFAFSNFDIRLDKF